MGGEGVIIKNRGVRVGDLVVGGAPRTLKMACGENPKRVYGYGSFASPTTPMSRMGNIWKVCVCVGVCCVRVCLCAVCCVCALFVI